MNPDDEIVLPYEDEQESLCDDCNDFTADCEFTCIRCHED